MGSVIETWLEKYAMQRLRYRYGVTDDDVRLEKEKILRTLEILIEQQEAN